MRVLCHSIQVLLFTEPNHQQDFFSPCGHFICDILVGIWLVKLAASELSVHLRAMNATPEAKTRDTDSQTHTHNTLTTFQRM